MSIPSARTPGGGTPVSMALLRQRWGLLRLLGGLPRKALLGLVGAMALVTFLPAVTALAVGTLVGRVVAVAGGASFATVVPALALVGALLVADQIGEGLLMPARTWVATRVNGNVQRLVRRVLGARAGVDHLDDQLIRSAAVLATDSSSLMNIGAGAEGQLWVVARYVGAFVSAAVVASVSVPVALIAMGLTAAQRSYVRRQYAAGIVSRTGAAREDLVAARYWVDVAGGRLAAKEARVFGFGGWAVDEFSRYASVRWRLFAETSMAMLPKHAVVFVVYGSAVAVPLLLLGSAALDGGITAEQLTVAIGGVVAVTQQLGAMGQEAFAIDFGVTQLGALRELQQFGVDKAGGAVVPTATPPVSSDRTRASAAPDVWFEDVTFRYPGSDRDVLRGFTLHIEPGQSVALVGENGAGKTTILKLLARFHEPTGGRILVDGVDLREIDPVTWRRQLAVVLQDFARFELTAFENVAVSDLAGRPSLEDARAAAAVAGVLHVIEALPDGWSTVLSKEYRGGVELSGGEWQRIALARMLYQARRGGRVLVLDEPTANLDVIVETELFDRMLEHATGLTAVLVSHRYSTVRRAEHIVVLQDGAVREQGSHAGLIAKGGEYARLYDLQARRFVDPVGPGREVSSS